MSLLDQEKVSESQKRLQIPDFAPGDAVEIVMKPPNQPDALARSFQGVVIAKHNSGFNSSFEVLNQVDDTKVTTHFFTYSPWIVSFKVTQKAFVTGGKKRVKRAKLYYLQERDGVFTTSSRK